MLCAACLLSFLTASIAEVHKKEILSHPYFFVALVAAIQKFNGYGF